MELKIWSHLIQILSYRNDLINQTKSFFENLNNRSINDEKYIPYLNSISDDDLELLYNNQIIPEAKYTLLVKNKKVPSQSIHHDQAIEEIIQEDNLEEMKKLIREKDINEIGYIIKSFREVKTMKIPIIIDCIIQKAVLCFKYLLINEIEDPLETMNEQNSDPDNNKHRYEWDCMTVAIFFGKVEFIKILEEYGITISTPQHLEAATLSYRNRIVKDIIYGALKQNQEQNNDNLVDSLVLTGFYTSTRNNNIREVEWFIRKGANINGKDIIYQIIVIFF